MSAMRSSPVRRRPTTRRPVWGIVGAVVLGTVGLLAIALGLVWFLSSANDAETNAAPAPLPCTTTLVTPIETLPAAESVVVNVFNSTDRAGLAAQTADELRADGYVVKKVGNAKGSVAVSGSAELRFGPKGERAAERLRFLIPDAVLVPIDRSNKRVDVVLGTAYSGLVDEAVAVASMASPSPSLSGPGCVTPPASASPVGTSPTPTPSAP